MSRSTPVPQHREEDDVPDGGLVGEDHDEAVDPHPHTAGGRHPVLHGPDVVLVDLVCLVVAARAESGLALETTPLVHRVIELGEGVGDLLPGDEELESLGEPGLAPVAGLAAIALVSLVTVIMMGLVIALSVRLRRSEMVTMWKMGSM